MRLRLTYLIICIALTFEIGATLYIISWSFILGASYAFTNILNFAIIAWVISHGLNSFLRGGYILSGILYVSLYGFLCVVSRNFPSPPSILAIAIIGIFIVLVQRALYITRHDRG